MSKRRNLRIRLAEAIEKILGTSHAWTVPNCMRYVKPNLKSFTIRPETKITFTDWDFAIKLAMVKKEE